MNKERLQILLQTARNNERQALAQLSWMQGKVAQLEELLAGLEVGWPVENEDDSGDAKELSGGGG